MKLPSFLKSIGAVLTGFVTVFVLSVAVDMILERAGIFPPPTNPQALTDWMCAVALAYRSVITVLGGYITAKLSPNQPMKHVIALGIIGTIVGIMGTIIAWDLGHHWYPIALAATTLPLAWYGGKLSK
jgi:hypothetical protein